MEKILRTWQIEVKLAGSAQKVLVSGSLFFMENLEVGLVPYFNITYHVIFLIFEVIY